MRSHLEAVESSSTAQSGVNAGSRLLNPERDLGCKVLQRPQHRFRDERRPAYTSGTGQPPPSTPARPANPHRAGGAPRAPSNARRARIPPYRHRHARRRLGQGERGLRKVCRCAGAPRRRWARADASVRAEVGEGWKGVLKGEGGEGMESGSMGKVNGTKEKRARE